MKIWILQRVFPDEYDEVHYQFFTTFKTVEGAKRYVESMEKDNMEGWEDAGYAWVKKSHIVRGYWEISSSHLHD